jgi:beta-galactosidase
MKSTTIQAIAICSVAVTGLAAGETGGGSRLSIGLNPAWRFQLGDPPGKPYAAQYEDSKWEIVSLPHSHQIFSANLAGFRKYGRQTGWYRREIEVPEEWLARKVFLEFRGAMQTTTLWVNGKNAGDYAVSGFDSFDFDITPYLRAGTNVLAVQVDNRPSGDIPPDGTPVDYILFGGLYRDVFLHVVDPLHLTFAWEARQGGVRLSLPVVSEKEAVVQVDSTVRNESARPRACTVATEIRDYEGKVAAAMSEEREVPAGAWVTFTQKSRPIAGPHLWSPEDPYLYQVLTIVREGDRELDRAQTALGIRWVKFDKNLGFFLNGQRVKLVGANYHQTWPFIGGAVPDGLRRRDAEQLKEMGVNWVRLSHYPHDPALLDAFDEFGLMALEEPPTWMDQKPGKWMANLEASFRSMIRRDRNHACVIVWSPCINHHPPDPALLRAAREEDPPRDRGNDTVMLPMNFQPGVISGEGALAIEHTGHMFPAKRGIHAMTRRVGGGGHGTLEVSVNREYEQAERHWEQLNAARLKEDNAGLAVWCMYDYNTFHNVNENGMVWHGVCDLFRIPKYSYYWHQSELTSEPMAYVVRVDSTSAAVFSNCERVRLWQDAGQGYREVATQKPDKGFSTKQGQQVTYALRHPPFHFTVAPAATRLKAEGLTGRSVMATYEWKQFGAPVALALEADRPAITADGADLSRIIVSAVDANGTPVETCGAPVTFAVEGLGQLIGENPVKLRAGKMIILAQSAFAPGEMTVTATADGLQPAKVTVRTEPVPAWVDMPKNLPAPQPTLRMPVTRQHAQRSE